MEEEANCVRCGKFKNTLESEDGRVCDNCIMRDLKKLTTKSELDDLERMK